MFILVLLFCTPILFHISPFFSSKGYKTPKLKLHWEHCWLEELESMDRCTGCRDLIEIQLKTVLNKYHTNKKSNIDKVTGKEWKSIYTFLSILFNFFTRLVNSLTKKM